MKFHSEAAGIFIPDGQAMEHAVSRTTHMAIAAHQDDIEMMAAQPIIECFNRMDLWFSGVVVTDGRGSPRVGRYKVFSDDEMSAVRKQEQFEAASIGKYAAQVVLGYPSATVKNSKQHGPVDDLLQLLRAAKPRFVYTHNLADKHDTHVAIALRVIAAIRAMPLDERPEKLYGCEVWRGLDWLTNGDQVKLDVSAEEDLQLALLRVFDSQIAGGKRYDLASMGRRQANATFSESHSTDTTTGLSFAMDMSPLIYEEKLNHLDFVQNLLDRFAQDVIGRLQRLS